MADGKGCLGGGSQDDAGGTAEVRDVRGRIADPAFSEVDKIEHRRGLRPPSYKQEFIRFLTFAQASCDETTDHLETLCETGSLANKDLYSGLHGSLDHLGRKLNLFTQAVENGHLSDK